VARLIGLCRLDRASRWRNQNDRPSAIPENDVRTGLRTGRPKDTNPTISARSERVKAAGGVAPRPAIGERRSRQVRVTAELRRPGGCRWPTRTAPTRWAGRPRGCRSFQGWTVAMGGGSRPTPNLRRRRSPTPDDLKGAIYYEVRHGDARSADRPGNQLEVALGAPPRAGGKHADPRRRRYRFHSGRAWAGNIEVVQAQSAVTQANDDYIARALHDELGEGFASCAAIGHRRGGPHGKSLEALR